MKIAVMGAGKIGSSIALLLSSIGHYHVVLADQFPSKTFENGRIDRVQLDICDDIAFEQFIHSHQFDAIISCLPYFYNVTIAKKARQHDMHYFDLTEDVQTAQNIMHIANEAPSVFMPQCGLAPGIVNIIAHDLMRAFDTVETVQLRVGALPQTSDNALGYALTWSTDGLINQYGNPCEVIVDGEYGLAKPLEGLETIVIDGVRYEAFNTSGGLGNLAKDCIGVVRHINYKTLRYPGHCEKMKFLMNDLQLNQSRDLLKTILEKSIPSTQQDVVVMYVMVSGHQGQLFLEKNYVKKLLPYSIEHHVLTAIQMATASGICAVVDIVLDDPEQWHGFLRASQFSMNEIIYNRFGKYYA